MRSGIADYSRDLVGGLIGRHAVDVYVASPEERLNGGGDAGLRLLDAHDFPWRQARAPYDLVLYQLGNSWCHDYMWPYVFRYPGLAVLHDGHLHHARASSLLRRGRTEDYRAELWFNHPDAPALAAEPALHGFSGPLYYRWPMLRSVVAPSMRVAVHNADLARELAEEFPETPVDVVTMGVPAVAATPAEAAAIRLRHGFSADALILAAFGGVTPEKRLGPLLAAAAVARRYQPALRLLFVGAAYPHFDPMAEARAAGVADLVTTTGYVPDADLPAYLAAADVVSCLRFPTARETSASWLRALAAGRPTLVTDLGQVADVPTIDPRSGVVVHSQPTSVARSPIAVSIDLLDETHSLTLALKRLTTDAALRETLGANAREYWRANHTVDRMIHDYERVIHDAAAQPVPRPRLPPHLRPDSLEHARALASSMGVALPDELT